jgi:hypothetical protein
MRDCNACCLKWADDPTALVLHLSYAALCSMADERCRQHAHVLAVRLGDAAATITSVCDQTGGDLIRRLPSDTASSDC